MIATKVWGFMDPSDMNGGGLSRHHILAAVEGSLSRLQTHYIDLYQVHMHRCVMVVTVRVCVCYRCIVGMMGRLLRRH